MTELLNNFPEGYNWPKKASWFTKIEPWENELRILDWTVEIWFEYWNTEKQCIRSKTEFKPTPTDLQIWQNGKPQYPKEVWVMKVYNYWTKQVETWAVTQAWIKDTLWTFSQNSKLWGLWAMDITVTKAWSGIDTTYTITPITAVLTDEVKKAWEESSIDLKAYFNWWQKEDSDWFNDESFVNEEPRDEE